MPQMNNIDLKDIQITVLGAGIAGLTAAHELVQRGFKVRVVERCSGPLMEARLLDKDDTISAEEATGAHPLERNDIRVLQESPDVGGVARSQWATARPGGGAAVPFAGLGDFALRNGDDFDWGGKTEDDYLAVRFNGADLSPGIAELITDWFEEKDKPDEEWDRPSLQLVGLLYEKPENHFSEVFGAESAFLRLKKFADAVRDAAAEDPLQQLFDEDRILPCTMARVPLDAEDATALERAYEEPKAESPCYPGLLLRRHYGDGLIPGEHGFRFFPGFYRHLRDTMKRTLIYDDQFGRYTNRNVHDNLREVEWQIMSDPTRGFATAFRRKPPSSVAEFIEQWHTIRNDLGFRDSDMLRFVLRLARYATSSNLRREFMYEDMSWWDFISRGNLHEYSSAGTGEEEQSDEMPASRGVDGDEAVGEQRGSKRSYAKSRGPGQPVHDKNPLKYGFRIARALKHSPRALVAMDATVTDARTQGNLALQLAMDQLGAHEMSDSTLDGPSSEAWFHHWKRFLELQGVEFHVGEVVRLNLETGDYKIEFPREARGEFPAPSNIQEFVVCALDPFSTSKVLEQTEATTVDLPKLPRRRPLVSSAFARSCPGGNGDGADFEERAYRLYLGLGSPAACLEAFRAMGVDNGQPTEARSLKTRVEENWPYQTLSGVQLFFDRPTGIADGHIYFGESPWGLMGVSQLQYWRPRKRTSGRQGEHRHRGNLSLVYGAWREQPAGAAEDRIKSLIKRAAKQVVNSQEISPYLTEEAEQKTLQQRIDRLKEHENKELAPWESPSSLEREALVEETVRQIRWSLGVYTQLSEVSFPAVRHHHVDDFIQFRYRDVEGKGMKKVPTWNLSPYLINLTGKWSNRPPGEPWSPNERRNRRKTPRRPPGYQVFGRIRRRVVFAGAHMRTFTRMGTMEAANESGRHAANAILKYITHAKKLPVADADPLPEMLMSYVYSFESADHDKRGNVRPKDLPLLATSIAGDYCSIFDPERHEIHDLEFLKHIDRELLLSAMDEDQRTAHAPPNRLRRRDLVVESAQWPTDDVAADGDPIETTRKYPHLFDLLRLDDLPDKLDEQVIGVDEAIQLLSALLRASRKALQGPDPIDGAQHLIRSLHDIINSTSLGR